MLEALIITNAVLGFLALVGLAAYAIIRYMSFKNPSTKRQLHVLKEKNANWIIPYNELRTGKLLGKGSQGEVFQGTWITSEVAVKKVDVGQVDPEIIDEFCQEADIMRRLRHPNLTLFLGVSVKHPHLAIVTEIVKKGSLFDLLKDDSQPLTWKRCLQLSLDIAQGMQYLHEHSPPIIHRDLKSLNILVDANWRAKVADFGMTRFHHEGTMTQCGSPLWMSPEMIRNDPYDEKADVYSFGIVLWELYTKKIPYRGSGLNPSLLVVKVVKEDLRPAIPLRCPLQVVRLIEGCWHPNPNRRPSFKKITKTLQSFMKDPMIINHKPMSDRAEVREVPRALSTAEDDVSSLLNVKSHNWRVKYSEVALKDQIGQGRSATVFSGTFRGKGVAIKRWMINKEAQKSKKEIDAKVSEIMEGISVLRHPNILLFMGAYFEPDSVGMIVEHMERGTIRDLVRDSSVFLEWDTVLQFLIDAAQGMAYLHGHSPKILHGDFKSTRLLVDHNWRVKVSGYGIVDFASTIQSIARSAWMAPEVLKDPLCGNAKSNVYSFGIVLWEVVTRKHPFEERFSERLASKIIGGLRPTIPTNIHPKLAELMTQCWVADPSQRPCFTQILETLKVVKTEGPPKIELSLDNAVLCCKATTVYAYRSEDPITIFKDWGKNLGRAGCYVIRNGEVDVYLCDADVFSTSYEPVDGRPHEYRKIGYILAKRMEHPFAIKTGSGIEHGNQGDFLVQNKAGDQWVIDGTIFPTLYTEAPNQHAHL